MPESDRIAPVGRKQVAARSDRIVDRQQAVLHGDAVERIDQRLGHRPGGMRHLRRVAPAIALVDQRGALDHHDAIGAHAASRLLVEVRRDR
jgi:hypothetical protein